jgi:thiol-disulfide isomerase/thioredoxin
MLGILHPVAVDKRVLIGSLAAAVVISVGGGYALSASSDSNDSAIADDDISIDATTPLDEPVDSLPNLGNLAVEGEKLPSVMIHDAQGNRISTDDLLGQPLLINFWATICVQCKDEMPALARVHADYGDRVRFIGLNQLVNGDTALAFAADKGVQYELMSDEDGEFATALEIKTLPYTLLVAPDGTIIEQKGIALDEDKIRAAVDELLAASS